MAAKKTTKAPKSRSKSRSDRGHGGTRAGAGRKTNADREKRKNFNEIINSVIAENLHELLGNMLLLARGIKVEVTDADGGTDIYAKPPDRGANEYLINRLAGKPTERHEHDFSGLSDQELIERAAGSPGGDAPTRPDAAGRKARRG